MDNQKNVCLLCVNAIGRDFATKIINGVTWRLHRCMLNDCANKFNKMSEEEQQNIVLDRLQMA